MNLKTLFIMIGAMCALTLAAAPSAAQVTTGDTVAFVKSFETADADQTLIVGTAGIAFDPTYVNGAGDYDRLFLANRSAANAKHGLYSVMLSTEAVSGRLALAADSNDFDNPADITVDANGDAYVVYDYKAAVWKVTDPTGAAVETQIMGDYGGLVDDQAPDDDPRGIDMMPSGFGLAGYGPGDLLLVDSGMNNNNNEGAFALKSDGSNRTELWYSDDGVSTGQTPNGASSEFDGKLYFCRDTMETVDVGGTIYPSLSRIGGDGVLETIAINMPAGMAFTSSDNSMDVNPADGSLWIPRIDNDLRSVVRVDVASAADQGGGIYLADATVEISWGTDAFNVGTNGVCWSPDGEYFIVSNPSGVDSLHVFQAVPEPGTFILLGIGLISLALFRRKM